MDARGLSLVLVIRGGLWLGECLDVTAVGLNVLAETHPRTFVPDSMRSRSGSPTPGTIVIERGRYVACIVSFFGSQSSPFFHRRNTTAAILRASVTFAISSFTPRASEAS